MNAQLQSAPWQEEHRPYPRLHPRILVADDDPYLVRLLRENLELEGYDVTFAYDGMHAITLALSFQPSGDPTDAIEELVGGLRSGTTHQVLLGVTGSGKTFTAANVIAQVQKPTLVLSPNKILAAQLYAEFKQFFPG